MEFFDSHAHYNDEKFKDDREQVLKEIYESGVTKLICSGYDIPSSKMAIDISGKHKNFVYPVCGISPNDIANNELSYEIPETNPEEIAPGYNKSVKIEDYKELKGDDGIEENIIKKITVTVSYKVNGKSESITLEAMVTKES